jgi:hypothetical protein
MHARNVSEGGDKLKMCKRAGVVLAVITVSLVIWIYRGAVWQSAPSAGGSGEGLHSSAVSLPSYGSLGTTASPVAQPSALTASAAVPMPQARQAVSNSAWANPRGLGAAMDEARTTRSPVNALAAAKAAEECLGLGYAFEREAAALALPKGLESRKVLADSAKEMQRKLALCTAIPDNSTAARKELILIALEGGVPGSAVAYLKLDGFGNPQVFAAAHNDAKNGDLEAIFSLLVRTSSATGLAPREYQVLALALKKTAADPVANELATGFMNAAIELDQKNLKSRLPGGAFLEAVNRPAPDDVQAQAAQIAAFIRQRRS